MPYWIYEINFMFLLFQVRWWIHPHPWLWDHTSSDCYFIPRKLNLKNKAHWTKGSYTKQTNKITIISFKNIFFHYLLIYVMRGRDSITLCSTSKQIYQFSKLSRKNDENPISIQIILFYGLGENDTIFYVMNNGYIFKTINLNALL